MIEVLEAVYNYFKNDDGKDANGNWLDDYDHRTYLEILNTDTGNFHKHLIPVRQPELVEENLPIVSFYTVNMPTNKLSPFFKDISVEFDIYTKDATLEGNLKTAKRHFQLLEGKIRPVSNFPYIGRWYHLTEMQLVLANPNIYCYAQRFVTVIKREFLTTGKKK